MLARNPLIVSELAKSAPTDKHIGDKANGSNDLEQELRPMTVEKDDKIDMETLSDILREVEEETMTGETREVKK